MQTTSTKKRTGFFAAILAAILLCLLAVTGLCATAPKADGVSIDPTDPSDPGIPIIPTTIKIGISLPNSVPYYDILGGYLKNLFEAEGFEVLIRRSSDGQGQSYDIDYLVDQNIMFLIVAPAYPFGAIANALDYAKNGCGRKVEVIILGGFDSSYPSGITYMILDYYGLGINNAVSIMNSNPNIDENSVIYVYYHDDGDGIAYLNGIIDTLVDYGLYANNIKARTIGNTMQVISDVSQALIDESEINEIVTYDSDIAQVILQYYYSINYQDAPVGVGTGIRVLPLDDEDVAVYEEIANDGLEELGEKLIGVIINILSGNPPSDEMIGDSYVVYYYGFARGRVQYVDQ